MDINTFLDIDLVAAETDDQVDLLLELRAPELAGDQVHPPRTVVVCLDRSGSMSGEPLKACKTAIVSLVRRLAAHDTFGLVVFDGEANVVVPAAPISVLGVGSVTSAVQSVRPGGNTDLSAGYLLALREARRTHGPAGATVLLLSDGHANAGLQDPAKVGAIAQGQAEHGVSTSTIGYGLGYDEELLAAAARGGSGEHVFAEGADDAVAAVASQVDGLLQTSVSGAMLVVRPVQGRVTSMQVVHDLPGGMVGDDLHVALGSLVAGEERKVLLALKVPAMGKLGLATVAEVELRYTELPGLVEHTVTLPVSVNVVPGDEAAGRVPRPVVVAERLLQQVQSAKKDVVRALKSGDNAGASAALRSAQQTLTAGAVSLPVELQEAIEVEGAELERLSQMTQDSHQDNRRTSKSAMNSYSSNSRSRNRRAPQDKP